MATEHWTKKVKNVVGKGARATGRGLKHAWNYTYPKARTITKYTLPYIYRGAHAIGRGLKGPAKWVNENKITTTAGLLLAGLGYGIYSLGSGAYSHFSGDSQKSAANSAIVEVREPAVPQTTIEVKTHSTENNKSLEKKVEEEKDSPGFFKSIINSFSSNSHKEKQILKKPIFKNKIGEYDVEVYDRPEGELDLMKVEYRGKANAFGNFEKDTWNYFYDPQKNRVVKAQKTKAYGYSKEETEFDENNPLAERVLTEATQQYHQYLDQLQRRTIAEMRNQSGTLKIKIESKPLPRLSYPHTEELLPPAPSEPISSPTSLYPSNSSFREILERPKDYRHPFNTGTRY